ncbi:hypothetical protein [Streptomyces sp. URMC 123]|uniref:hypothetical protein n=1 Tax=Streptomyces sp. URMC 123 TaxID=3423403 RepID=UPI003F1A4CE2
MSGPLRLVPGGQGGQGDDGGNSGNGREGYGAPGGAAPGPARREVAGTTVDPLAELAGQLGDVCAAAVHPYEIAAVLESEGLADDRIVERYARRDLFDLAEELWTRTERGFPEPEPPADPWRADGRRCLLHGLVVALPGLAYVMGARFLQGPPGALGLTGPTTALAVSVLVSWSWNQALAHRAYLRLGRQGRRAAARCLLAGAPVGALLSAVPAALLSGTGSPGALTSPSLSSAAFTLGEAAYLAAATVLLVLGRERDLLLALVPTAAGAAAVPALEPGDAVVVGLLLTTVASAVLAAGLELRRSLRSGPPPEPAGLPRLSLSLPYGVFGLSAGVLTLVTAVGGVLRYGAGAAFTGSYTIALTLSMGAAQWLLYRFRSSALASLRRSLDGPQFLRGAGRALIACLVGYLGVLGLLAVAALGATVVDEGWRGGGEPLLPRLMGLLALLALGAALWLALLLQAFGAAWPAAVVCAAAAAGELACLAAKLAAPVTVQLVSCGGAAAVLLAVTVPLLGRATAHR